MIHGKNTFGQLVEEQQEHSGTVTIGSVSVGYAYGTGGSSSNEIRLNQLIYPNGRLIDYIYATGMDSTLNRVTGIVDDATSTTLSGYTYLGLGMVVRITYSEPGVWLDLWGGTSGTFNGLDQFNRIIDQRWQNSITTSPTDIDRYQYGYDQNSNRLWKANVVGTAAVGNLDEGYTYDTLNRLTQMQCGTLSDGTITGTPTVQQNWSLDPLGNWSTFATAASGSATLDQQRTANPVNEITAIAETTGPAWVTPVYDAAGNTTTMPQVADPTQAFTAVYDAWNRMVSVSDAGGDVGGYSYDGRNRRIIKVTSDETRHFYWTANWQDIEERVGTATTMDKQYVWGLRYIDELVCRDDATPERLYSCQDANFNVTAITDESGSPQQRFLYSPYGNSTILSAAWIITTDAFFWTVSYKGLLCDNSSLLIYNRYRDNEPSLGRLLQRDPLEYDDSLNLYQYVQSNPPTLTDPSGLVVPSKGLPPVPPTYAPGLGAFNGSLLAPGSNGEASADFALAWQPFDAKKFAKTCCKQVAFIQIYYYKQTGHAWGSNPWKLLTQNAWTSDSDDLEYYPFANRGISASMTDTPGWLGNNAAGSVTFSSSNYETCAVCEIGPKLVFGCVKWGFEGKYDSAGVTSRLIYLDSAWDLKKVPPALPRQYLKLPRGFAGWPPSSNMMPFLSRNPAGGSGKY